VLRVYDEAGNVIETHEHEGELKNGDLTGFGILSQTKSRHVVTGDG